MSIRSARSVFAAFLFALVVTAGSHPKAAGLGFQGRLTNAPSVVSGYEDTPNLFSVALCPHAVSALNPALIFSPKLEYATAESGSLTFKTKIRKDVYLIPISIEGRRYVARRTERMLEESRRELFIQGLKAAKEENRRQGLSIGVNLPKRFDQMFGEGGANLRVSGYRRITFSGRSQWNDNAGTGLVQQSKFPSLNMEQISRFDITGTIGSKITVKVSQDNQTDIPLANRLLLRYKGDEDDVVQAIEAGNTQLSIPNTQFVGYSSNIQGLFGLKTEAKLGNLELTAIASQEKGSSESATVSASGTENKTILRDYQYAEGRIYDLGYPGWFGPNDEILLYKVYQYQTREGSTVDDGSIMDARNFIDPTDTLNDLYKEQFPVVELTTGYQLWRVGDTTHCPFALVFENEQRKAVGVYMKVVHKRTGQNPDTVEIGSIAEDTLRLMCVRSYQRYTPDHPAWELMWRNCYRITKGLEVKDIKVKVMKGKAGTEGSTTSTEFQMVENMSQGTLLRILGMDLANSNGLGTSDNKLDNDPAVFRPEWGLIMTRSREPFNSDTTYMDKSNKATMPLYEKVPDIYTYASQSQAVEASKYYFEISSEAKESIIRLGRANVIEGSERVTANGRVLEKGRDYNIQYDFGQVTLLSDDALDPNADVKVEFQYAPFLSLQKKTLLGARAEYEWSDDLKFGSTILYKSDKAQERKPKIGQETATAMVLDFDIAFALHPFFLTKAVNALPLVSTEAESRIGVTAEIAQSRPNPNVDGVAYIDDFEAAVEELSIGMSRNNWTMSSTPRPIRIDSLVNPRWARGAMRWHNPGVIPRADVYEGDIAAGEGNLQPLRLIFRPEHFVDSVIDSTCTGTRIPTRSWGGMMRYFGNRVDAERVQLFEFRARGGKGVLHFDFGYISEDINGDGIRETEDRSYPENNALETGEDVGLDLVADANEAGPCGQKYDPVNDPDPAGDNWWFEGVTKDSIGIPAPATPAQLSTRIPVTPDLSATLSDILSNDQFIDHFYRYEWMNGTEGNQRDDAVQGLPDDEALVAGATSISTSDAYFTVAVSLEPTSDNVHIVPGSEKNGWYTYRVPIREPGAVDTQTDGGYTAGWEKISYVRVWFDQDGTIENPQDSLNYIDSVWIANWGFIQSSWSDTLLKVNDNDSLSKFYVASVSEDVGTFEPPPGVEAYHDDLTNTTESQRGLALVYKNLPPGDTGITTKTLLEVESYSGYRDLQMYVHGPDDLGADSLVLFFRIGADTLNYYEYHVIVEPGWVESNYVTIDFNEITALKDAAIHALKTTSQRVDTTDGHYRVVGRPNLNQIGMLSMGVVNVGTGRVTGEIWVDELRLADVRKDVGTAVRVGVDANMADLFSHGASYEHKDPYFRGLSQATRGGSSNNLGSGSESNSFSYNARLNLDRFLPRSWGASLPVSFNYSYAEQVPLLRSGTDIILPDSVREEEKSTSTVYTVSVNESFSKKGSNPLFSALLNRQKVSLSYRRSYAKTVTSPWQFGESYNIRGDYDMGIKSDMSLPVFFWTRPLPLFKRASASKLSFFPTQWKWSAEYVRSINVSDDQDLNRTGSFSRQLTGSTNMQYAVFPNITLNYSMNTRRNLSDPSLVRLSLRSPKLGEEESYRQDFRTGYDPKVFGFFTTSLEYQATFSDTYDRSTKSLTTDLNRSWSIGGNFRHLELLGGRSGKGGGQGARPRRGGVEGEEKPAGKPFYEPVLAGLRFMTGWLNPLSYNYTESMRQSVPGLVTKPSWKYRLALETETDDFVRATTTRNPSASKSMGYKLGSGFGLLGGITTTLGYSRSIDEDVIVVGQHRSRRTSTGWPELSITIQKFKTLPLIKGPVNWFIGVFSPRTAYSRQLSENYDLDDRLVLGNSETVNRNPLLSLTFKVFKALSLSGSYTTGLTTDKRFNSVDGRLQSETRNNRQSVSATSKYSFTAPGGIGLPLFGKVKFKSTVSIDLNVKYDMTNAETSTSGAPFVVTSDKSSFSVSPKISYSFSKQIQGGLTARWQDTNDLKLNRKSHLRELQIWTEITF